MNSFIKLAIERPIAVIAFMVLIVMFGFVAARTIPIQMSPDIEKPIFQVRVNWAGATPEDVDREIVNRLENELSNLSSVEEISSNSRYGNGSSSNRNTTTKPSSGRSGYGRSSGSSRSYGG